ncbi:MAG: GDP-mannose 4,6-dehydratase, partial [Thermoplasmata archaeon]
FGTGEIHTVREFAEEAFKIAGIHIRWEGEGEMERGLAEDGKVVVQVKRELYRPLESDNFLADYSKAKERLGWKPKTRFEELVKLMVEHDLKIKGPSV